jgi:hypothetical protein
MAYAAELFAAAGKGLVPAWATSPLATAHPHPHPPLDTPTSPSALAMSRVVLTRGRALLDPALVVGPPVMHAAGGVGAGSDRPAAATAVSTWVGGGGGGPGLGVGAAGTNNMLLMLLPASAVRWGKVWSESTEGTMETLLNNMKLDNSTGAADGSGGDHEGIWVEIGCSVVRAQLVRNVTLAA